LLGYKDRAELFISEADTEKEHRRELEYISDVVATTNPYFSLSYYNNWVVNGLSDYAMQQYREKHGGTLRGHPDCVHTVNFELTTKDGSSAYRTQILKVPYSDMELKLATSSWKDQCNVVVVLSTKVPQPR
jgi:hypothetical protein